MAREFREEHRQALDWLNQRTGEETQFCWVIWELLRIDDSRPAINFKLAASPNEWRKESMGTSSRSNTGTTERGERYRNFFQILIDRLREEEKFTTARKAQPLNEYNFASGYGGIGYRSHFNQYGKAGIAIYIDRGEVGYNKDIFDRLISQKDIIESELAANLEWSRLDDYRASRIDAVRSGSIDDDDEALEEVQGWMIERLLAFKRGFGPRLAALVI